MQELWGKISQLFWDHPVLWLPYICAELSTLALGWMTKFATRAIIQWSLTTHSALGADYPIYDPAKQHLALILASPVGALGQFMNVCLMVSALVLTALLLESILRGDHPGILNSISSLKPFIGRILWFSIRFCVCMALLEFTAFLVVSTPIASLRDRVHWSFPDTTTLIWLGVLAVFTATAWIVTPWVMKLIQTADSSVMDPAELRLARNAAMLAAASSAALAYLYEIARTGIRVNSAFEGIFIGASATIVINVPLLLLFLALPLIVSAQVPVQQSVTTPEPDEPRIPL